jgi:hypothetical protein
MNYISVIFIAALFVGCNFRTPKNEVETPIVQSDLAIDTTKIATIRLTNPTDNREALDSLDQGNLSSLIIAGILFHNCVTDSFSRDSIFWIYHDFINIVSGEYLENNEKIGTLLVDSPSVETVMLLKSMLSSYGLLLDSSSNTYFLEPHNEYLLQKFGRELSPAYREFLTISDNEQHERFSNGGGILIPTDSLTSRILKWENFIVRYPRFILIKFAQDQYAQYLGAYLAGMENSRIFDPYTNLLNEGSRTSFESFILNNPESSSAKLVKAYLNLLSLTNFGYTEKVDSFLLEKVFTEEVKVENN